MYKPKLYGPRALDQNVMKPRNFSSWNFQKGSRKFSRTTY